MSIPFDVMLPISSKGSANIVWTPLTRDGGARLNRQVSLFDLTNQRDSKTWSWNSTPVSSQGDRFRSGQDTSYVLSEPKNMFDYPLELAKGAGHQMADIPGSTWLMGGAIILASSALDTRVDQWAQNHQSDNWQRIGNFANNIPYYLAAGVGLAYLGAAGDDMSSTATASVVAGTLSLGANLVTKYAVGRSRPADDLGPGNFSGFNSSAAQSSFASNHTALAFALVTPFAKQYDQPWLYGLAGVTAIGRLQSREHWFSDTVAGGLLGYAVGSTVSDQQASKRGGVRVSATPLSVDATWSF